MMDKIFIAGAGGIGRAAALLILYTQDWDCLVVIGDVSQDQLDDARAWIERGIGKSQHLETFLMPADGNIEAYEQVLGDAHVLLDCLPGALAPAMVNLCLQYQLHYANLTEYVKETQQIMEMTEGAETGFILQTGLAPGYVNNLAVHLMETFEKKYGGDRLEHLAMRVGALTQYTTSPHYYGFTWSTIGVATEYIKDSEVVRDHQITRVPSLSEHETIIINGRVYEADLTSGGAADLPHALKEKIRNIDYKTIRYPGHFAWVKSIIDPNADDAGKIASLENKMLARVPHVEDDVIVIYASLSGYDKDGHLRALHQSYHIYPLEIGGITMRAIQTCTAAPLVECARMLATGEYSGVITQSQIAPEAILEGTIVRMAYHVDPSGM